MNLTHDAPKVAPSINESRCRWDFHTKYVFLDKRSKFLHPHIKAVMKESDGVTPKPAPFDLIWTGPNNGKFRNGQKLTGYKGITCNITATQLNKTVTVSQKFASTLILNKSNLVANGKNFRIMF